MDENSDCTPSGTESNDQYNDDDEGCEENGAGKEYYLNAVFHTLESIALFAGIPATVRQFFDASTGTHRWTHSYCGFLILTECVPERVWLQVFRCTDPSASLIHWGPMKRG